MREHDDHPLHFLKCLEYPIILLLFRARRENFLGEITGMLQSIDIECTPFCDPRCFDLADGEEGDAKQGRAGGKEGKGGEGGKEGVGETNEERRKTMNLSIFLP